MIRLVSILIGIGFAFVLALGLFGSITAEQAPKTVEHEFHLKPKDVTFASDGPLGGFSKNQQQLQRGFQVFKEVCSACHSLRLVSFRDLQGIGYSEAQIKTIAAEWAVQQPTINEETGEPGTRPNLPSDRFPLVYANEAAARAAQNGAVPPDLSLMTKARPDGAAYVYSLLTGYSDVPAELTKEFPNYQVPPGLNFNRYFPTLALAMAQPIASDGQVTYTDGTPSTVDQMAKDVAAFLIWTAEPKLEARKQTGLAAIIFILIFTVLAYGAYRNIWRDLKH